MTHRCRRTNDGSFCKQTQLSSGGSSEAEPERQRHLLERRAAATTRQPPQEVTSGYTAVAEVHLLKYCA
ncbi:hypothetical protein VZT92_015193 [Zoarces viviparus]|uniref:Uncharacterized protein n=1 Tax=Zoarces viviparus TaxID=48416 RepID=A0AAW1EVP1_ZOAVI